LVKIVYDELVKLLGEKQAPIAYATVPPTIILVVGLQGSGKTTTAGKLAKRLKLEQKAPFLVAADVYRPAAVDQLVTLAKQVDVGVHAEPGVTDVPGIVKRALVAAEKARARTVIVDTAGRLQIDDAMMAELQGSRRDQAARDPAGGGRHDRPGRGADRVRVSTRRSASPAWC
jgi:signal recognition particle subunit SRP54